MCEWDDVSPVDSSSSKISAPSRLSWSDRDTATLPYFTAAVLSDRWLMCTKCHNFLSTTRGRSACRVNC